MIASKIILALAAAAISVNALPLNINLGAYSPALVVGDGAISFDAEGAAAGAEGAAQAAGAAAAGQTGESIISARDVETKVERRDIAGFDRALTFAEAALTKGPKVQLGTGAFGAGVGIVVDNKNGAVSG